ncbi:MAG: MarR family transcriptional regulator [Deltaproteobacteria bacterium]|nr:MarR family transcriptional regulator [Deltaproteobacteria bacterium]
MVPLVAVPYMGEVGRRLCENADIGWIDLSGNALIRAKDLFVRVEGRPNRFKTAGRPPDVFAPKSARIARWLLMHPDEAWTQRELARSTGMDEGFVSRIVKRLAVADLVSRDESGRVRSRDANLLLDAWAETYRFENHTILKGHVAARSGEDLVNTVADRLGSAKLRYAATGLAAAWLYCRFASFRLASFYLAEEPTADLPDRIGFREDPRGANLWLVLPKDMGVFQETRVIRDVTCVHPVQVYLDLAGHPERAPEAAERLRADFLKPGAHD